MCRSCRAAYHHELYEANRARYITQAAVRRKALHIERTRYLLEHFKTHPCSDCGEADPVVLEFDHVGPKLFNIASDLVDRSWPSILAEIEQCEVVCANCHRRRTVERRGGLRFVMSRASEESA
jgi:hypothetical protein